MTNEPTEYKGTPTVFSEYLKKLEQLFAALPHKIRQKGGEEEVVFDMDALSDLEILDAFTKVQKVVREATGIITQYATLAGYIIPEITIPVRIINQLNEANAKTLAETLAPIVHHADKIREQRNSLVEIFGIVNASRVGRSNINWEDVDKGKPMGYTFWIPHTRSALDYINPSIAQRFNRALGGRPLFHMMEWNQQDSVRIWIAESDVDALVANPNKNRLFDILAKYVGGEKGTANRSIEDFQKRAIESKSPGGVREK